jgi:predicted site-specific integrase-resolvase
MHTIHDIAERYQVSRDTVLSWITDGLLPAIDVAPSKSKRRFYRVEDSGIAEFEKNRSTKQARKTAPVAKKPVIRQFV